MRQTLAHSKPLVTGQIRKHAQDISFPMLHDFKFQRMYSSILQLFKGTFYDTVIAPSHLSFNLHKCGIYLRQTSLLQLINNSSYAAFAVKELKLLIQELCNYRIF